MAPGRAAASFDEIIQADRKKRKAEALANEIFGKNRRQGATGAGSFNGRGRAPTGAAATLASRVGVTKRSSSAQSGANINKKWNHDLHSTSAIRTAGKAERSNRFNAADALHGPAAEPSLDTQLSSTVTPVKEIASNGNGILIRGMAGPYIVMASNFAPGTTAADIESVMQPIGGQMTGCKLVSSNPTVIVEMGFVEKSGAENVIAMFNNKRVRIADGRLLYVYMKQGASSASQLDSPAHSRPMARSPLARETRLPREEQREDTRGERDVMDVDEGPAVPELMTEPEPEPELEPASAFVSEPVRPHRYEEYQRPHRRAEPDFQDGRAEWEGRRTRTVMDEVRESEKKQADMSMAWDVGAYGWNEKAAALGGLDVTIMEIDEENTEDTKADKENGGVQDNFIKDLKEENRGANGAVMVTV
ncbi:hypothetical protein B0A49_00920 [Cryomyces minteri]|uniref:RRM domain-containing protein n=1 Tax=Cryomyces minteri TaxID=331657 RepID=A0A4U0XPC4_9PEZI|nr:hypothetical protein B0A49_00920 [Cryomyces minteri]